MLTDTDIPKALRDVFGESKSQRINTMVLSVIENSDDTIRMDEPTAAAFDEMHRFLYKEVYYNPVAKAEEGKVDGIIRGLYIFFEAHPDRLPEEYKTIAQADGLSTAIKDYIAGMTDPYALQTYSDIYIPKSWNI